MLTEKERAIKIVELFTPYAPSGDWIDGDDKKCGLVFVDEMITEIQSNRDYMYKTFCCEMSLRILENQVNYWDRVKNEIEKL